MADRDQTPEQTPDPAPAQSPSQEAASEASPAQPASATAVAERPQTQRESSSKPLPPYNVVLLDDDQHTYEYVIELSMKLFARSRQQAFEVAKMVDTHKRAVLLTTHKEHAELKRDQVHSYGRDFRMETCKGSMSCIIEPAFADNDAGQNSGNPNSGGRA
jgi:ATP-dependent Clp protease adaptor protein ClpS